MKRSILILTSPWSNFPNHADASVARIINDLNQSIVDHHVIYSELEVYEEIGHNEYWLKSHLDPKNKEVLTLVCSQIDKLSKSTTICYIENDGEGLFEDTRYYFEELKNKYPDKELLFFANDESLENIGSDSISITFAKSAIHAGLFGRILDSEESHVTIVREIQNAIETDKLNKSNSRSSQLEIGENTDYSEFISRFRSMKNAETTVRLPIGLNSSTRDKVEEYSKKYRVLDFNLGYLDFNNSMTRKAIVNLPIVFEDSPYSFRFHCDIESTIEISDVALIENTRIDSVRLLPFSYTEMLSLESTLEKNLHQINLVKRLHQLDIDVTWNLAISSDSMHTEEWGKFVSQLSHFYSFPAPEGIHWIHKVEGEELDEKDQRVIDSIVDVIQEWKNQGDRYYLSMGNGPSFSRLFDKRSSVDKWKQISFNAIQTALYSSLNDVSSKDEMYKVMPEIPKEKIDNFLAFLDSQNLVMNLENGRRLLNVSKRRGFSEAWATAEL